MKNLHAILAAACCVGTIGCDDSFTGDPACEEMSSENVCFTLSMDIDSVSDVGATAPGDLKGDLRWKLEALTDGKKEEGVIQDVDMSVAGVEEKLTIPNLVPGSYQIVFYLDDDASGTLSVGDPFYDSLVSGRLPPGDERRIVVIVSGQKSTQLHMNSIF